MLNRFLLQSLATLAFITHFSSKSCSHQCPSYCHPLFVRMKGLEPPRLTAQDPKSCAATNYATSAWNNRIARFSNRRKFIIFFGEPKTGPHLTKGSRAFFPINLLRHSLFQARLFLFKRLLQQQYDSLADLYNFILP